jgi:hypothetical protein
MPAVRDLLVPAFPGWEIYREHTTASVPPSPVRRALRRARAESPGRVDRRSMLLHGDIRADNMFFDGDRLKVVDFQFTRAGRRQRHRLSGQPGSARRRPARP